MQRFLFLALMSYLCASCGGCTEDEFDEYGTISEERMTQIKAHMKEGYTDEDLCNKLCEDLVKFSYVAAVGTCVLSSKLIPNVGYGVSCSGLACLRRL